MSSYDDDYPKVPIGKGNPYFMCKYCGVSAPEINGYLSNHKTFCEYRIMKEQKEKIEYYSFLLYSIYISLPSNKDWLDPEIEKHLKTIYNQRG